MLAYKEYDRLRAVEYAKRWALDRNPLFSNFAGRGGDCTSFVSQCLLAGCCTMNFTNDFGWYYISDSNRAPTWSSVEFFYDFIVGDPLFVSENGGIGPFGIETSPENVKEGDIVQLANTSGDFYHTLIITGFDGENTLVSAHTNDALNKPLSEYNYASLRYIKIEGVRFFIPNDICFNDLYNGIAINVNM